MVNNVHSALSCSQLLLQLAGINVNKVENTIFYQNIKSGLKELNKTYGVKLKQRKIPFSKLTTRDLPLAFLSTKDDQYWILAKINQTHCLIQHPFKCRSDLCSQEELHNHWSGVIITLSSLSLKFNLGWFIPAFWQHRHILTEILLFSMALQLLALILPLFFQIVMDKVLAYTSSSTLDMLIFGLVVTSSFEVLLRGLREYQYIHTANRIDILLGIKLVKHLLGLPLLYFKNRPVGSLVARIRQIDSIREFLSGSLFTLLVDISFMSIFLLVMWRLSPTLSAIVITSIPCYAIVGWYITTPLQTRLERQFQYNAINSAFLTETIAGIETIKSLAVEPCLSQRWEKQIRDLVDASYCTQILSSLSTHLVQAISKLVSIIILWCGARAVINLEITLGQLIAFNMLAQHFSGPLAKLVELWGQFVQAQVAVDKLGDIINLPIEQENVGQQQKLTGDIVLEQVKFRYQPAMPLILQGISLHVQAGTHIGIVGESGSGKSTLARLLLRLYLPEQGQIFFDNNLLNALEISNLRRQVAVVLQENFLFNRSVRDNIALSLPQASLEKVINAAELAGAHEFILHLPMGYDTILAEGGTSLSGGQRQRIAIARALLIEPKILIFDEATSALDDESQTLIQNNMAKIVDNKTVITIAHRLSTVRSCDCIVVLHQGQIIEQGTHKTLLALGRKYGHLWQLQQDLQQEGE